MKKYVKKATALLTAATMVASLTACGGGDAPAASEGDTPAGTAAEESAS